jgi:hypothetical protein
MTFLAYAVLAAAACAVLGAVCIVLMDVVADWLDPVGHLLLYAGAIALWLLGPALALVVLGFRVSFGGG